MQTDYPSCTWSETNARNLIRLRAAENYVSPDKLTSFWSTPNPYSRFDDGLDWRDRMVASK